MVLARLLELPVVVEAVLQPAKHDTQQQGAALVAGFEARVYERQNVQRTFPFSFPCLHRHRRHHPARHYRQGSSLVRRRILDLELLAIMVKAPCELL